MQWFAIRDRQGGPAMREGEEVLFACHLATDPSRQCLLLAQLRPNPGKSDGGVFAPRWRLHSTWDGKPVEPALVPYAYARPTPPEPRP